MNPVTPKLLAELRNIWKEKKENPFKEIHELLNKKFLDPNAPASWERCLIYGTLPSRDRIIEERIGYFIAVAPGIIIVDCYAVAMPKIAGLLTRSESSADPFQFHSFNLGDKFFSIKRTNSIKSQRPKLPENCSVFFNLQVGGGMSGSNEIFGIEPARWQVLEPWLNKWLPENK